MTRHTEEPRPYARPPHPRHAGAHAHLPQDRSQAHARHHPRLRPRRLRLAGRKRRRHSLLRDPELPALHRRRPRGQTRHRDYLRSPRRGHAGPRARLRRLLDGRGHLPHARARPARLQGAHRHQRRRRHQQVLRAGRPRLHLRPHQPHRPERRHRPQRSRASPSAPALASASST